ncbi:MAG TPA: hypothetical protein DCD97_04385, partial [Firmicutes bacterium]|nr:hypothetical protein [Bacillota bacterium]
MAGVALRDALFIYAVGSCIFYTFCLSLLSIKHTKEEMDSTITGTLKMDRKTKMLCKRLKAGDIALIAHRDLDELAAQDLVEKGIKAVINADDTFSGEYPALGTSYLLQRGVFILDHVG